MALAVTAATTAATAAATFVFTGFGTTFGVHTFDLVAFGHLVVGVQIGLLAFFALATAAATTTAAAATFTGFAFGGRGVRGGVEACGQRLGVGAIGGLTQCGGLGCDFFAVDHRTLALRQAVAATTTAAFALALAFAGGFGRRAFFALASVVALTAATVLAFATAAFATLTALTAFATATAFTATFATLAAATTALFLGGGGGRLFSRGHRGRGHDHRRGLRRRGL
ncbi:MAG: hypothetical protein RI907_760, partial [Pseudomonadota bacterium]